MNISRCRSNGASDADFLPPGKNAGCDVGNSNLILLTTGEGGIFMRLNCIHTNCVSKGWWHQASIEVVFDLEIAHLQKSTTHKRSMSKSMPGNPPPPLTYAPTGCGGALHWYPHYVSIKVWSTFSVLNGYCRQLLLSAQRRLYHNELYHNFTLLIFILPLRVPYMQHETHLNSR